MVDRKIIIIINFLWFIENELRCEFLPSTSINCSDLVIKVTKLTGHIATCCSHILLPSQDLKSQKYVKLSIVHCPPVTIAIIKRPDPKFQLGFSVEDGIVRQYSYFYCHYQRRILLRVCLAHKASRGFLCWFTSSFVNTLQIHWFTILVDLKSSCYSSFQTHLLMHPFLLFPVADLQSDAGRYSRERRHTCRAPHHWNKRAKCCRHTTRQDHPDPNECNRRGDQILPLIWKIWKLITFSHRWNCDWFIFFFLGRFTWRQCQPQHIGSWQDRSNQCSFEHVLQRQKKKSAQCSSYMNFCQTQKILCNWPHSIS